MNTRLVSSVEIPFLLKREKFMINFGLVGLDGFRNAKFFFFLRKLPWNQKLKWLPMPHAATSRALVDASHRSSSLGGVCHVAIPTYSCACVHASFKLGVFG